MPVLGLSSPSVTHHHLALLLLLGRAVLFDSNDERQDSAAPVAAAVSVSASPLGTASPSPSTPATATPASSSAPSSTAPASADPAALTRCRDSVRAAENAVAAARTGVRNWNTHVQTRTELLSGRVSKAVATKTFKRTRLAGAAEIEKFDASYASYAKTRGDCEEAGRALPPACATRASTADTAARRADDAMGDAPACPQAG